MCTTKICVVAVTQHKTMNAHIQVRTHVHVHLSSHIFKSKTNQIVRCESSCTRRMKITNRMLTGINSVEWREYTNSNNIKWNPSNVCVCVCVCIKQANEKQIKRERASRWTNERTSKRKKENVYVWVNECGKSNHVIVSHFHTHMNLWYTMMKRAELSVSDVRVQL